MSHENQDDRGEGEVENPERGPEDLPGPDEIVGTFFAETSLWPLVIVVLGSLGSIGAGMIVLALKDQNIFAAAALFLVAGLTVDIAFRARRENANRNIAKMLGLLWLTAGALALVAVLSGIA